MVARVHKWKEGSTGQDKGDKGSIVGRSKIREEIDDKGRTRSANNQLRGCVIRQDKAG